MIKKLTGQIPTVVIAAATAAIFGGGGAYAAAQITSAQIQDQTIQSRDIAAEGVGTSEIRNQSIQSGDIGEGGVGQSEIRNGSVYHGELSKGLWDYIQKGKQAFEDNKAQAEKIQALEEQVAAQETRLKALEADDETGVNKNWKANGGATIDGPNQVTLKASPTTSVEIQNLDLPVDATKKIKFTYELKDGAAYGGGSPRVFIEVGGTYINTFDADPADAGTDNGDGTFTKEFTIGKNGRVGAAGVVADFGSGSVVVTDLSISGHTVAFQ